MGGSSSSSKALLHIVMKGVRNINTIFWLGLWLYSSPWAEIIMATLHPVMSMISPEMEHHQNNVNFGGFTMKQLSSALP